MIRYCVISRRRQAIHFHLNALRGRAFGRQLFIILTPRHRFFGNFFQYTSSHLHTLVAPSVSGLPVVKTATPTTGTSPNMYAHPNVNGESQLTRAGKPLRTSTLTYRNSLENFASQTAA
jgi:hypothetical protein